MLPSWAVDFTNAGSLLKTLNMDNTRRRVRSLDFHPHHEVVLCGSYKLLEVPGVTCDFVTNTVRLDLDSLDWPSNGTVVDTPGTIEQIRAIVRSAIITLWAVLIAKRNASDTKAVNLRLFRFLLRLPTFDEIAAEMLAERVQKAAATPKASGTVPREVNNMFNALCDELDLWMAAMQNESWSPVMPAPKSNYERDPPLYHFGRYSIAAGGHWSLISTSCGFVGPAPSSVAIGDRPVLVRGQWPFLLLRRRDPSAFFEFQGVAYIKGFMGQDRWKLIEEIGVETETFILQ